MKIAKVTVIGGEAFRANLMAAERRVYGAALKGVAIRTRIQQERARDLVDAAFTGSDWTRNSRRRVSNAIRSKVYDNGRLGAAGLVYSAFGRGRGASFVDFVLPRLLGGTIRPEKGKYLAIKLPAARGQGSIRFITSLAKFGSKQRLDWVPTRNGFLVKDRRTGVPLYILVKSVTIRATTSRANLLAGQAHGLGDDVIAAYAAQARGF